MSRGPKILVHPIRRVIRSQCLVHAYCPGTVATRSQGNDTSGAGFHGYDPGLPGKLLPKHNAGRTCECRLLAPIIGFRQEERPVMHANATQTNTTS